MIRLLRAALVLVAVLSCAGIAEGQEWTRFRGPNGLGVSPAKTVPSEWSKEDINWQIVLPGAGHSSPVAWGSKIFVTSGDRETEKLYLLCIQAADGAVLWQYSAGFKPFQKNSFNTYASGTPCVDESRVYACWALPEHYSVVAVDHAGSKVWETDL